jgi:hypothetical protein
MVRESPRLGVWDKRKHGTASLSSMLRYAPLSEKEGFKNCRHFDSKLVR